MSGIHREVYVHSPAPYYLRDVRVFPYLNADMASGSVTVEVDVRRHPTASTTLPNLWVSAELHYETTSGRRVVTVASRRGGAIPTPIVSYDQPVDALAPGTEATVVLGTNVTVPSVEPWSAERPTLYRMLVTLYSGSDVVEARSVVVGFRQVTFGNPEVACYARRGPVRRGRRR